jgi:hypothetical protein
VKALTGKAGVQVVFEHVGARPRSTRSLKVPAARRAARDLRRHDRRQRVSCRCTRCSSRACRSSARRWAEGRPAADAAAVRPGAVPAGARSGCRWRRSAKRTGCSRRGKRSARSFSRCEAAGSRVVVWRKGGAGSGLRGSLQIRNPTLNLQRTASAPHFGPGVRQVWPFGIRIVQSGQDLATSRMAAGSSFVP